MASPDDSPLPGPPDYAAAQALAAAGIAALQQDRYAEAIEHLTRAAAAEPANSAHQNNLGLALVGANRRDEARGCFERAVAIAPHSAAAHYNLGGLLLAQGDFALAESAYRAALMVDPQNAGACNNLGLVLSNLNRRGEAVESFRRALQLRPRYAAALSNLGKTLVELDQLTAAEQCLREALEIDPRLAAAHNNLGLVLLERGELDAASRCFQTAIGIDPHHAEAYDNWGVALRECGRPAEAVARHQRAHEIQPLLASAVQNLAVARLQLGQFDEAAGDFRRVLQIDPDLTAAYFHLSQMRQQALDSDDVARLENALHRLGLSDKARSFAAFALGNFYDRLSDFGRAFQSFAEANRLAARKYEPAEHEQFVDRIIGVFTADLLGRRTFAGSSDERPVLIVGMPRSGTTLVEQIIASHPQAAGGGERLPLPRIATQHTDSTSGAVFPEFAATLDQGAAAALANQYLQAVDAFAPGAVRVTDKLPANYLYLGLAALLFPRARVIHCRRHPLDTCLSCYFQNFHQSPYAFDLLHLAHRYRAYRQLMAHWRSVLPGQIHDVDYETLVGAPDGGSRELIAACGLPWDDTCLRPHRSDRPIDTASAWQVRQPIYRGAVGRWRNYEQHLKPLIEALGEDANLD